MLFSLVLAYTLLYPTYVAPDEPQHVDMVVALQHRPLEWPGPAERALSQGVARSSDPFYGRHARVVGPYRADEATPRSQRLSLEALGGNAPAETPPRYPNQMVQHPPLYYAVNAAITTLVPGSVHWHYDQYVWFLRFLSALMLLPVPILAWATTRRLVGGDGPAARTAPFVPLLVPGFVRIGASVNNDNLLALIAGLIMVTAIPIALGDTGRRRAVKVGVLMGLAALTKVFGLVFLPIVAGAYVVARLRHRSPGALSSAAIAGSVAFVCGGWWYARNRLVYGVFQTNGFGKAALQRIYAGARPPASDALGRWWDGFSSGMPKRFWADIGVLEPPQLTGWVVSLMTVLLFVAIVVAVVRGARTAPRRRDLVAFAAAPLVLVTLGVAWQTYREFARTGYPGGMQGRYLYAAMVPTSAVIAIAIAKSRSRVARWAPLATFGVAVTLEAYALYLQVSSFWVPKPKPSGLTTQARAAWHALSAWSPFPRQATAVPFVLVAVASIVALVLCIRDALQTPTDVAAPTRTSPATASESSEVARREPVRHARS